MIQSILQTVVESVVTMARRQHQNAQPQPQPQHSTTTQQLMFQVDVAPNHPINQTQRTTRYNNSNRTRRPYQPSKRTTTTLMNQVRPDPPTADPPVVAPTAAGTAVTGSIDSNSTDTHTTTITATNTQTTNPITDTHEPVEKKDAPIVAEPISSASTTGPGAAAVAVEEEFVTVSDSKVANNEIPPTPYQLIIPGRPTCLRGVGRIHLKLFPMVSIQLAKRIYELLSQEPESSWSESRVGSFGSSYISHHERVSSQWRLQDGDTQLLANHLLDSLGCHGIALNRFEHAYAIRYQANQFWRPHYSNFLTTDNPRAGSAILFVNSLRSHEGGEVRFPTLGCQIRPVAGWALFFQHLTRDDERLVDALFEELPVLGTTIKYVIHMHICRQAIVNPKEMVEP